MKRLTTLLTVLITLILSVNSFAIEPENASKTMSTETVEINLLEGVKSDNAGLQVSSAYYLGEMKSEKAVVPLLGLFNNAEQNGVRVAAALALVKIGDARGIKAIEYASRYDESKHVKDLCKLFYATYVAQN